MRRFFDFFDRVYIINLPDRPDRRAEMENALAGDAAGKVQFFPAIRPIGLNAPFYNPGVEGCSRSHLNVLRHARHRRYDRVLVLEDDAEFIGPVEDTLPALSQRPWGMVVFGHIGPTEYSGAAPAMIKTDACVFGSHCYGVSRMALEQLIALFERQHRGLASDGLYAPMPADFTLNAFRILNPDIPNFVVAPSLVRQRASRSDVKPRQE